MSSADPIVHSIAGVIGSLISQTATYPLVCVSSKLQAARRQSEDEKSSHKNPNLYNVLLSILRDEGVQGLYAGYSSAMFGALYSSGVYYYFYELFNRKLAHFTKSKELSTVSNILSAAFAGSLTALFANPLWVINTRTSVEKKKENRLGVLKTLMKIIKEDGVKSLWSGVIPSLILVINPLIQYVLFERAKILLSKRKKPLNGLTIFLLAAITKLLASFLTYPYLLVRTKLQVKQNMGDKSEVYNSTLDCIKKIYANEGLSGFYKGLSLKLLHSVITTAILFFIKEEAVAYVLKLFIMMGLVRKRINGRE